jgi:hypothetical protein
MPSKTNKSRLSTHISMLEEMAIDYFHSLSKPEKKNLIKKIFDSLSEKEKVDIAKMLLMEK